MKGRTLLINFLIIILAISCKDKVVNDILEIKVSNKVIEAEFNTLIKSYEIIPLETNLDSYFQAAGRVITSDSMIFILDLIGTKVLVFNQNGKHISSIGRVGRGPGEVMRITDFIYSQEDKVLTLFDRDKAKRYLLDESYLGELDLNYSPDRVLRISNDQILIEKKFYWGDPVSAFELRIVDNEYKTLNKRLPLQPTLAKGTSFRGQSARSNLASDHAYYYSLSGDTIFHIKNGEILPAYSLIYDKPIFIQKILSETDSDLDEPTDFYDQLYYFEIGNSSLLFFQNMTKEIFCLIYDKENNEAKVYSNAMLPNCIIDDKLVNFPRSVGIEKRQYVINDSERAKVLNPTTLDSLIEKSMEDSKYILKVSLDLK